MSDSPIKAIIVVDGGIIKGIYCTHPLLVEFSVVDKDDQAMDPIRLHENYEATEISLQVYNQHIEKARKMEAENEH